MYLGNGKLMGMSTSPNPWHLCTQMFLYHNSYRDDWALRHFLHPKLLRKAREVRQQLEDIMNFQKMPIVSAGTDFDIARFVMSFPLKQS